MHRDEKEKGWRNGGLTEVLIRSRRWIVPIVEKIKESPTKRGPGMSLVRTRPSIVCAHTLNVLSSWSGAKSAGPAKRAGWLAGWLTGSTVGANRPRKIVGVCHWRSTNAAAAAASPSLHRRGESETTVSICLSVRRDENNRASFRSNCFDAVARLTPTKRAQIQR